MRLKLFKRDELFVVALDDILYMKAEGHYTKLFFTKGNKILLPYGLSQIEEELKRLQNSDDFVKLGRSYIVNIKKVVYASTTKEYFTVVDNNNYINIKVSKNVVKKLITMLRQKMGHEEFTDTEIAEDCISHEALNITGGGKKHAFCA